MARKSRKNRPSESGVDVIESIRAGIYTRESVFRENSDKSESITNQRRIIQEYIHYKHQEFIIAELYEDRDFSGTDFNRPGFEKLMKDVGSHLINCIIVKDLSRLGRNMQETGDYLERVFPALGVRVIAISDNYDSKNMLKYGLDINIPLINLFNEFYAHDISMKVSSTKRIQKSRGEVIGKAPYGYKTENHKYAIDETGAEYVRQIYKRVIEGWTVAEIVRALNVDASDNSSQQIKGRWSYSTVRNILTNPVYIGSMVYNKAKRITAPGKKRRVLTPSEEWEIVPDTHDAIIPKEDYDSVQKILRSRRERNIERKNSHCEAKPLSTPNIFKGRLICGDCSCKLMRGRYMTKRGHEGMAEYKYYFSCNTYRSKGKGACTPKHTREEPLLYSVCNILHLQIGLSDAKEHTSGILDTLVSCICVYDGPRIEIKLNYKDEYVEAMRRIYRDETDARDSTGKGTFIS